MAKQEILTYHLGTEGKGQIMHSMMASVTRHQTNYPHRSQNWTHGSDILPTARVTTRRPWHSKQLFWTRPKARKAAESHTTVSLIASIRIIVRPPKAPPQKKKKQKKEKTKEEAPYIYIYIYIYTHTHTSEKANVPVQNTDCNIVTVIFFPLA